MQAFFNARKGEKVDRVCANCKWLENLPFSSEFVCGNGNSEYADCPCDDPNSDTCDEFCERES